MATVLIVEDDFFICRLAEQCIREWGYETLVASDVDEALAILRSSEHIDILFTDINLKGAVRGGCLVAKEAMRLRPTLLVLYVTGNLIFPDLKALFINGAQCMRKPYTDAQLHDNLDTLLAAIASFLPEQQLAVG